MGLKKTIKMVLKVLRDPNKRALYSKEELLYMEMQVHSMRLERQRKKFRRKQKQGFGYGNNES